MRGYHPPAVETVLDRLQEQNLLSDERFAEQYVGMRQRRGYGPLRIRAELRERGVDATVVAAFVDHAGHDWHSLVRDVRAARFGHGPPADRRETARQVRFLSQRGFPEALIRELLLDE